MPPRPEATSPHHVIEVVLSALAQQPVKPVFSDEVAAGDGLQRQVAIPPAAPPTAGTLSNHAPTPIATDASVGGGAPNKSSALAAAATATPLSAQTRASGDAVACLARFHDPLLHSRLQPKQGDAATLLAAAEQVRCLELGARLYPGIATSQLRAIADRYAAKAAERRSHPLPGYTANNSATDQAQALADLLWMRWHDGDANQPLMQQLAMENPQLVRLVNQMAGQLQSQLYSQRDFATLIRDLAQRLGIASTQPDAGTEDEGEDQADNADGANDGQFTPETGTEPPPASMPQDPMPLPPSPMQDAQAKVKTVNENGQESQDLPPRLDPLAMVDQQVGYHVYSREDDEVADAASLLQSTKMWTSELLQDHDAAQYRQLVKRLAMKLEKLLRTERPLYWQGNQLDGALDPKRLARLVTSPLQPPIFRQPSLLQTRDTVVSLLLDCSGSMRGRPIRLAMLTVDVLLQTLERCHISTELLGFTTRSWKGGRAREKWMEAGKPPFPGRLNDLRHLLFKTANQRWQQRRNSLGALLQEGVLKENIDGEALMWAARRLLPRPERRKILLVISDGAPVDDATIAANDEGILERHLRAVIAAIQQQGAMELAAIGIGHQVDRFYPQALTIRDSSDLGEALVGQMANLLRPH